MPTPLQQIQGVDSTSTGDMVNYAQLAQIARKNALDDQQRALNNQIGNALINQGPDAAANIAAQNGHLEQYNQIKTWAQTARDADLKYALQTHKVTADLLDSIAQADPENQPQFLDFALKVAQSHGVLSPQDVDGIQQEVQQKGHQRTLDTHRAILGTQGQALQDAATKREAIDKKNRRQHPRCERRR